MRTNSLLAVLAPLGISIALTACGASTPGRPSGAADGATIPTTLATTVASSASTPDPTTTSVSPTTVAARVDDPTITTLSSTIVAGRPTALVDELIPVHDGRLHLHCDGAGLTTVLLIAGFSGSTDSWAAIEPTVAQTNRVCAYDRFGNGASDAPPGTQTFTTQAADLHTLLHSAGEPGPYLIVGHSFGGAQAVTFASMFPTEVRGLLLLDASPPAWNTAICAVPDDGSETAGVFQSLCAQQSLPANNVERLDAPAAFAQVAHIDSLSEFPMIVATADHHPYPGLAASEETRLNDVWNAGQAHWTSLVPSAQLISVDNTSHNLQLDRPDAVLDMIHQLLQ
jgi:pimeloyl-ACP methyl ester carboxylesterase